MNPPRPAPLEIDGLHVDLGGRRVLAGASLTVGAGELVGLAGPNGSGKTTLLRAALGLLPVAAGQIRLGGRAVPTLSIRERARRVAWMPQSEPVLDNVPALEYVLFGRYAHLAPFEGEGPADRRRATDALAAVGLGDRTASGVLELSGGERQRLLLARALVQEAPLLLLDEPMAHLDVGYQLDLLERVQALARRRATAVLLALHDLNLAARFVERVVVLHRGRIVDDGAPSEVLSPELLRTVWGVDAELRIDPASRQPYLIPRLPAPPRRPSATGRGPVHVVGGGGTASALLRELDAAGWRLTAGVLPLLDTDTETARELGIPAAVGVPFAPITDEERAALRPLLADARLIVVAPIPVGPANVANLEELAALPGAAARTVLLEPAGWSGRDFTHGAATALRDRLRSAGARSVARSAELWPLLDLAVRTPPAGPPAPVAEPAHGERRRVGPGERLEESG